MRIIELIHQRPARVEGGQGWEQAEPCSAVSDRQPIPRQVRMTSAAPETRCRRRRRRRLAMALAVAALPVALASSSAHAAIVPRSAVMKTGPQHVVGASSESVAAVSPEVLESDRVVSTVTLTMKDYSITRTHRATVTAWVAAPGQFATGTVTVKEGKRVLKSKDLKAKHLGHVTMKLPVLSRAGKHHLRVKYSGNDEVRPGTSERKTLVIR